MHILIRILGSALSACSVSIFAALLAVQGVSAAPTDDVYSLGPDSMPHEGVPKGTLVGPRTLATLPQGLISTVTSPISG